MKNETLSAESRARPSSFTEYCAQRRDDEDIKLLQASLDGVRDIRHGRWRHAEDEMAAKTSSVACLHTCQALDDLRDIVCEHLKHLADDEITLQDHTSQKGTSVTLVE